MDEFNTYISVLCNGILAVLGAGGDGALDEAIGAYSRLGGAIMDSIVYAFVAPGFILLIIWYTINYAMQISSERDPGINYWFRRAGALLIAAILIFPASALGLGDKRPIALWLSCTGLAAGMELAGNCVSVVEKSGRAEGDSAVHSFLALPGATQGICDRTADKLIEQTNMLLERVEEPGKAVQIMNLRRAEANRDGWGIAKDIYLSVSDAMQAATTYVVQSRAAKRLRQASEAVAEHAPAVATGARIGTAPLRNILEFGGSALSTVDDFMRLESVRGDIAEWVSTKTAALAAWIFTTVITFGFYLAVIMSVLRAIIYGVLVIFAAICVPMGRWGMQKLTNIGGQIIALIATPIIIVAVWYAGIVVRGLWVMSINPLLSFLQLSGGKGTIASIIAGLCAPFFLSIPLATLMIKAPSYIGQAIGVQAFSTQSGVEGRIRAPLAK